MTWPADGLPRYKAASVAKSATRTGVDWRPIGYVYDRGRCFFPVLAIRDRIEGVALRKAEQAAEVLNAGGDLTPDLRGERPHGVTRYKQEGCRCEECRGAVRDYNRDCRKRAAARA